MPYQYDGADGLWWLLTGATYDGGPQSDPYDSRGNYAGNTRFGSQGISCAGGPSNLRVDYASGYNGTGTGTLRCTGADAVAWTPPDGSEGAAITIANGQTRVVCGDDESKYLTVTRTSADALADSMSVTLADTYNCLWDNVTNGERTAGDTEIRCLGTRNRNAQSLTSLKFWLRSLADTAEVGAAGYAAAGAVSIDAKTAGEFADWPAEGCAINATTNEALWYTRTTDDTLEVAAGGRDFWGDGAAAGNADDVLYPVAPICIAAEGPSSQPGGYLTDRTGEGQEGGGPPGTLYHPVSASAADVVEVGTVASGYLYGLWIERKVLAGRGGAATVDWGVACSFELVP